MAGVDTRTCWLEGERETMSQMVGRYQIDDKGGEAYMSQGGACLFRLRF